MILRILLSINLTLFCLNCFSQNGYSSAINGGISPSATAYSFSKYANIPVNLSTGSAVVNIPFTTLQEGTLSHNVSMSYHTSGIRVGEVSSELGLGWHLNAGGIVTREIRGLPDDHTNYGYLYHGESVDQSGSDIQDVVDGTLDSEPDLFTYSIGGASGKFMFDETGEIFHIPSSDVKIEYETYSGTRRIRSFTVTAIDGTKSYFGYPIGVNTGGLVNAVTVRRVDGNPGDIESWHLQRIESSDDEHKIDFSYQLNRYRYQIVEDCVASGYNSGGSITTLLEDCDYDLLDIDVSSVYLDKITTSTQEVDFAVFQRLDLPNYQGNPNIPKYAYNYVEVKNGDFCVKYDFIHNYYRNESNAQSRLKLNQLAKSSCGVGDTASEPNYIFEYENVLNNWNNYLFPFTFSMSKDHWGYYNGAGNTSLIPLTTVIDFNGNIVTHGNANRETNFNFMKAGALKKITYPTGGSTSYTYEANQVPDSNPSPISVISNLTSCTSTTSSLCCGLQDNKTTTVLGQEEIESGEIELRFEKTHHSNCVNDAYKYVRLNIKDITRNKFIGSKEFNSDSDIGLESMFFYLSEFEVGNNKFIAGNNYEFEVVSLNAKGTINLKYRPFTANTDVGGLRIAKIETSDGISPASENIIRTFTYNDHDDANKSSGVLYNKPTYGVRPGFPAGDEAVLFSSNVFSPIANSEGYHITYAKAIEHHNGNGRVENFYETEKYTLSHFDRYPAVPAVHIASNGMMLQSEVRTESNILNKRDITEYINGTSTPQYYNLPGTVYSARRVRVRNGNSNEYVNLTSRYHPRSSTYRPTKTSNYLDVITTTNTIEYHPTDRILLPVAIQMTNSDGKVHRSETDYSADYSLRDLIKVHMITKNRIGIPYETRSYVDGEQVGGMRTELDFYDHVSGNRDTSDPSSANEARPYKIYNYKRNIVDGVFQAGIWDVDHEFFSYSSSGLPEWERSTGWEYSRKDYNSNKLLTKSKYNTHEVNYSYYTGSSLLQNKTNVDGTTVEYEYDGLMRLNYVNDPCNDISTSYTYFFSNNLNSTPNYIKTDQDFVKKTYSNVDLVKTRQYTDGLGRPIQTNIINGNSWQATRDNITSIKYDKHGRKLYDYRITGTVANNNGAYVTPAGSWHKTLYQYYNSPLNRMWRMKPQNFNYTYYYYYARNLRTKDDVKKSGTTVIYGNNQLYKRIVRDGNLNRTIEFADKLGRVILKRQVDNAESDASRLDTYTVYDDKNRVTHVLPPGALTTSTIYDDLYYKYEYDNENKITEKHIPGVGETSYLYDTKDLLAAYQDPMLAGTNQWYTYTYDLFGRELRQGMHNGHPGNNFTPSDNHIVTTYGTNSYDKDKIVESHVKILGQSGTPLVSKTIYNDCGVPIRAEGNNHVDLSNNSIVTSTTYDGAINPTVVNSSIKAHGRTTKIVSTQFYNHNQMPTVTRFKVDTGVNTNIAYNRYNSENELIWKRQGKSGATYLQQINYAYKNWGPLFRINQQNLYGTHQSNNICDYPQPLDAGNSYIRKDLFYEEIFYNTIVAGTSAQKQFNNNIANTKWQVRGRDEGIYAYDYDIYNRLLSAKYYDENGSSVSASDTYSAYYSYDDRGNIQTIERKGRYGIDANDCTSFGVIDDLDLTYAGNSNRLLKVNDVAPGASDQEGFEDGYAGNYLYDANGNLTNHRDRKITMTYNHLNLPTRINFTSSRRIDFTYDATGALLNKKAYNHVTNVVEEDRDYVAGIEFNNDVIESIGHSEGRVFYTNGANPRYEYTISDHLGNARVMYSDLNNDGEIQTPEEILWEGHYYPFGMEMKGPWMDQAARESKYSYNGIEKVDNFDLNVNMATFRTLDPALGRWWSVDPKAEANYGLSPYNSMNNDPISFSDPEGDLAFLAAVAIGAGIGVLTNGVGNAMNDQKFFSGAGKAALVGGIGGALGQFGGGSLLNDIAWGAVEGGITGGIGAELNGGNFGDGFLKGAAIGASATFAYNLPGAIKNAKGGYGFNTNMGSFDNLAKDAVSGGVVDPVKAQGALDFWADRFGGPTLNFTTTGSPSTSTTGTVKITGQKFIDGVGHVKRAIAHETGHWVHNLNWDGGKVGGTISSPKFINLDRSVFGGDGVYGYHTAIKKAGKYHIGYKAISNGRGAFRVAPAWNSFGSSKWWHLIPRRF